MRHISQIYKAIENEILELKRLHGSENRDDGDK